MFGQANPNATMVGSSEGDGIPVADALVIAKCGTCHARDTRGNMQRISWARSTPEGWQNVLKRMILVQGVSVTPPEARLIVKYLSTFHALAPAESRPVMYYPERRIREESNIPNDRLRNACGKCHAFAAALSWRRSSEDWTQFVRSHAVRHSFPINEEAAAFLSKAAPLHTPEWEAWSARKAVPDLTGRWLVTASMPGRGKYFGLMEIQRTGDDEFTTRANLTSLKDGSIVLRTGRAMAYAGNVWRGRSSGVNRAEAGPDAPSNEAREVMWIAPDHSHAEGRWFWGEYQEFGFDVQLNRSSSQADLLVLDRPSLKQGSSGNRVRLIGANFASSLTTADLSFGPGVTVQKVVSHTDHEIVAEVDVANDSPLGKHDVSIGDSALPSAIAIYDRVDYLKLAPESAVAAFADAKHPKGYMQFDAVGYQRGPDGKLHTADDVDLGPIDVTWSFEVFHAPERSSADFVAKVNESGLLIPAAENPGNNFDCWVIATAKSDKNQNGAALVGKSYVVVTVPTYTFNGRQYVRDLDRWIDDGPAPPPH